ncbi:hypothetical protein [Massilia genomosp. 1]|uniref:Uncharacterized protein n=1 Tax=Massilia genomosp. 1 TaxID=2609280 RepID=A0ABX0MV50_9BURK|nr:hypothetical protein [Massilia genomosp. 1]NHZ66631.1 hypothetical protein [Massilia genomosp. 1]
MNAMELISKFNPSHNLEMQKLYTTIQAKVGVSKIDNEAALHREHVKAGYEIDRQKVREDGAMDRERFKGNREDERLEKTISAQFEMEEMRGKGALDVERLRGENNVSVTNLHHSNNLALSREEQKNVITRMELELRNQIQKSGFDSGVLAVHKLIDEDNKRRASLTTQMELRSSLRAKIQEKIVDAVIDVRVSRMKHDLEVKRMEKQSELGQADTYFNMVTGYVLALLNKGKEQEAKDEIDRLVRQWEAV